MKFYKNLYIGDTVKNPHKIKRKLKRRAKLTNIYVVAYMAETGRLEIYHCFMLQQYYYKEHPPYVIGLAGSKDEAAQIIVKIAEEAVAKTGKADLAAYLFTSRE